MSRVAIAGVLVTGVVVAIAPAVGSAAPLPAITLLDGGAGAERRPFAAWTPDYPLVNVRVSTRPVRGPGAQPASRYWVEAGTYDRAVHGPKPSWRGAEPLVPGVYHLSIQGDAASQAGMPWSPFRSFRVRARRGEWTGPTSQKRYVRFTRTRGGSLTGLTFSVLARPCGAYASLTLPARVRVRRDGSFSAGLRATSRRWVGSPRVRIEGRIRRGFARGTIEARDLFEGCTSGRVSWSARRR